MQKVILVVVMIALTLGCGLGYMYKKSQGSRPGDSGPGTNWIWNNDWMSPGSPGPSPTPPDVRPPVGPVNPGTQLTASTYKEAVQLAGKEGKPVLAFFTASWCTWCQKMKQDTLVDPTVAGLMKNYVYVAVDVDREKDVARKFSVTSIPAYVITNGREETLKSGKDYQKAPEFAVWLNNPTMFTQPKVDSPPPSTPPQEQPKQPQRPPLRRQPQQQRPPQSSPPGS